MKASARMALRREVQIAGFRADAKVVVWREKTRGKLRTMLWEKAMTALAGPWSLSFEEQTHTAMAEMGLLTTRLLVIA